MRTAWACVSEFLCSIEGPSCTLIRHVCWIKRFGVPGQSAALWSGRIFFYLPAAIYYVTGVLSYGLAVRADI